VMRTQSPPRQMAGWLSKDNNAGMAGIRSL
jgi:hypothetical protein